MKVQVMIMTELLDKIKGIKHTKIFKYTVTIIIMIIFATAVNTYRQNKAQNDNQAELSASESQSEDTNDNNSEDFIIKVIKENKAHLIALSCVSAGLIYIKYKQKHKIKESR